MIKILIDLNAFSIFFVKNHPGYEFIKPKIEEGLKGKVSLIIPEILPFRAFWILTTKWRIEKKISFKLISDFIKNYSLPKYAGLSHNSIEKSFELSKELKHDIYDCYYLSIALQENAKRILTTDTGFEKICDKIEVDYENPVPLEILEKFQNYK